MELNVALVLNTLV